MKVKAAAMQAYPFIEPAPDDAIKAYHPGMTMRDEFAKAAMQGMLTRPGSIDPKQDAEFAYVMADAMMEARK